MEESVEDPNTRIVAVSNRLPVRLVHGPEGLEVKPGEGGLVTALAPVFKNKGGVWIGWSGGTDDDDLSGLMDLASRQAGYSFYPVSLSSDEIGGYYYGFSNEVVWPLFHDLQTRCNFKPKYWYQYLNVNRKFAEITAKHSSETDYIWIHDYHLMYMAQALKELGVDRNSGFFLHIPFPPPEIFMKLPWRAQILRALLEYKLVGFQTVRDRRNFFQCLRYLSPGIKISGRGSVVNVIIGDKQVKVGAFPISIDYNTFVHEAESKEVADIAWYLHEALPNRKVMLGVDRLDYTKGIPERLEAFRDALSRFPELRGKITLVQVVVPSREEVPEYQLLKAELFRLVGEINGEFTQSNWVPVHYLYRSLERSELLAYYRLAEIAIITPLKDGMNLVAKEYCACNLEESGVLILSEFAGVAAQLHKWAIMVNPYDVEGMSNAIHQAFHMDQQKRRDKMRKLRDIVRHRDIFWWSKNFLKAAFAKDLQGFHAVEDYVLKIPLISS
jgi:trehalose 6-phosphate synthase